MVAGDRGNYESGINRTSQIPCFHNWSRRIIERERSRATLTLDLVLRLRNQSEFADRKTEKVTKVECISMARNPNPDPPPSIQSYELWETEVIVAHQLYKLQGHDSYVLPPGSVAGHMPKGVSV